MICFAQVLLIVAIALVELLDITASSVSSIARAFDNNAAGNLLVAGVGSGDNGDQLTGISDQSNGAYTEGASEVLGSNPVHTALWYFPNCVAEPSNTVVTASYSATQFFISMCIAQYSGIATVSPVDQFNTGLAFGTSVATGNVTTTMADELMVSCGVHNVAFDLWTHDSDYTERSDQGGERPFMYQDRIVSSTLTDNATGSKSGSSADMVLVLVTFKAGEPATPPPGYIRERFKPHLFSPGVAR